MIFASEPFSTYLNQTKLPHELLGTVPYNKIKLFHHNSSLTQELCEDETLSLKIQDTSQYFCGSDSTIEGLSNEIA